VTWLKVDDGFYAHPKVRNLSFAAVGLWTVTASFASRFGTDGALSQEDLSYLLRTRRAARAAPRLAKELVAAGLWEVTGDGYRIHDFTDWNPTRAEVEARHRAQREAGRLGGRARVANQATAQATAQAPAQSRPPDPFRPKDEANASNEGGPQRIALGEMARRIESQRQAKHG
jgi:hypothetical protein